MGLKTKKLSFYKAKGIVQYQNLWHIPKLTKKQKKWSKFKVKVHSTEQGRATPKFRMLQTISPAWAGVQNTKKFVANKSNLQTPGLDSKKALSLIVKRLWFFDTAAPIPGVSSLKKRKTLYRSKLRAYKTIQSWQGILSKKQMKTFFGVPKMQNFSKSWTTIMLMESMYQSCLRKSAFTYNAQERNAFSRQTVVNGTYVTKIRFVNTVADLSIMKNLPVAIQSFYATKNPVFKQSFYLFLTYII